MPDIGEIIFSSDDAGSQLKNRYVIQHLTTTMNQNDIDFSWNYFAQAHGKGIVDGLGGTLKRLFWLDIMTGACCSSAKDFVNICHQKSKSVIVTLVRQAQHDVTRALLKNTLKAISCMPRMRKMHHINVLHQDLIEHTQYSTSDNKYVFRF